MPRTVRALLLGGLTLAALAQTGCNMVPRYHVMQAQARTRQLYEQNKALAIERQNLLGQLAQRDQQIAELHASGETMRARLDNLLSERNQLASMRTSPLSDSASRQFEDLARRFPGFEFDPQTGVSKIREDILFASGSDELRPEANQLLSEFASILNTGDASALQVLVVGHTDDRNVVKASTKAKHPDNWYLSAHRAISVTHALSRSGIKPSRMGVAGYGPHQPRVANKSEEARRQNRRVEIFVLAPGAAMVGWDPHATVR
jgi:chemotaxis protein MotB